MAARATVNVDEPPSGNGNGISDDKGGNHGAAGSDASDVSGGVSYVDPLTLVNGGGNDESGTADGSERRRRGRPRGSKNATGKRSSLDLSITDTLLLTIHIMLSERYKIEELALTQGEATLLAEKIRQVQEVFDVQVNPRTKAIIELGVAGGTIYLPRIGAYYFRMKAEANGQAR